MKSNEILNGKTKKSPSRRERVMSIDGALMRQMLSGGAEELRSNIEEVNRLNVFPVPDGDTGDNMSSTVESGLRAVESLDSDDLAEVMRVLSHGMLLGARGNSGVILSQFFKGVADGFENARSADPRILASALELGVKEAYKTVVSPTEGTILTVAREAVEYAVSRINPRTTIKSFFSDFVKELHASVERTPELLPALKEAGVVDSGGAGLFYLMDGFNKVLRGERIEGAREKEELHDEKGEAINTFDASFTFDESTEMKFSYCTELLVGLTRAKCDPKNFDISELESFLISIGDSCATVRSGDVVKIHVHTFHPDKALAYMLRFGEFIKVKIENMSLQHSELIKSKPTIKENSKQLFTNHEDHKPHEEKYNTFSETKSVKDSSKKYGIVAVSTGEGCDKLFKELGADATIKATGGKSPSASDFLESARQTLAKEIFIFPNNSNFILSAEQSKKIADDLTIYVIPTRSIAEGYLGLSVIDLRGEDSNKIQNSVIKAISSSKVCTLFTAARDTNCSGLKIKKGDVLGACGKDIMIKGKNSVDCALKICKKLLSDRYVLTVFKGEDANDSDALTIKNKIKKLCPEAEIYLIDSGQEVFEYIFLAE